jgi:serine/threonine-protein kinase SRPK3
MLQCIRQKAGISSNPGKNHVVQLLDEFEHQGKTGDHVCLVFPVYGHHLGLQATQYQQSRIPVSIMKEISRQILQGLNFLHEEGSIIHTGELNGEIKIVDYN